MNRRKKNVNPLDMFGPWEELNLEERLRREGKYRIKWPGWDRNCIFPGYSNSLSGYRVYSHLVEKKQGLLYTAIELGFNALFATGVEHKTVQYNYG